MADARVVANQFLELAEQEHRPLTPMQVLKLVYIAHGWSLGLTGRPLITQRVEAWQYGPVIPELYNAMRHFKADPVAGRLSAPAGTLSLAEDNLVRQVFNLYGKMSGVTLSRITHAPNTPWSQTFRPGEFGVTIPVDLITDHYQRLARERIPSAVA